MKGGSITRYFLTIMMFTLAAMAHANPDPIKVSKSNSPIEILSDEVRYLNNESKAVFTGKVEASQEDSKMWCDQMTVYFNKSDDKADKKDLDNNKIEKILLDGNVRLESKEDKASSDHGEYKVKDDIFILIDNVVLIQNKNTMYGDELVYRRKTGESLLKSKAQGNKKRVKALIIPESNQENGHIKNK
ncbi:MAG: LptA/OstA family protein [Alphaproteobacteria bacterium]|jgi:lipopolysaccharide transport protein LptA